MTRYLAFFFAGLLFVGCFGTEIGNPDAGGNDEEPGPGRGGSDAGIGGEGGTVGDGGAGGVEEGVEIGPTPIDFGPICPGGTGRERLFVDNRGPVPVDVHLSADEPVVFEPGFRTVAEREMAHFAAILPTTGHEATGPMAGRIVVTLARGTDEPISGPFLLQWKAVIVRDLPGKATLLCGDDGPCGGIAAPAWAPEPIRVPFSIVNDGCGDLLLEEVQVDGPDEALPAGPIPEGEGLPVVLAPGERWSGQLVFPASSSPAEGRLIPHIRELPSLSVPWVIHDGP